MQHELDPASDPLLRRVQVQLIPHLETPAKALAQAALERADLVATVREPAQAQSAYTDVEEVSILAHDHAHHLAVEDLTEAIVHRARRGLGGRAPPRRASGAAWPCRTPRRRAAPARAHRFRCASRPRFGS